MPHQMFDIGELLGLVINELVETSPQTAVSFALACRSFEVPTLSSLWREKRSLTDLVKVLPNHTWVQDEHHIERIAIEFDPSAEDWTRLRRYASWMRELCIGLDEHITCSALSRLSSNSPNGVLCPKLDRLDWEVGVASPLSFPRLFLSPRLKRVNLHAFCTYFGARLDHMPLVKEAILSLPGSLEDLSLMYCPWKGKPLKDAISSLVLRCGPSLRSFGSSAALSEEAVYHLMQLPNLRSWTAAGKPPQSFSPHTTPSLEELRLEWAVLPWLHFLAAREGKSRNGPTPVAAMTNTNTKETLRLLRCPRNTPVDSTLLSSISLFRNLVTLSVGNDSCNLESNCAFGLTDDDVENLVVTLPSLASLRLGRVCFLNSCRTTVSSLLSISIHCLGLTTLEIHFNSQTITGDIRCLLDGGSGRDKPRCELRSLWVGCLPLLVRKEDIGTIAMGFVDIFPCLEDFLSYSGNLGSWKSVVSNLRD